MPFAEVDDFLVNTGKGGFWHHRFDFFQPAIGVPHHAAIANHGWHGSVHNDVVGRVEVGDAFG